LYKWFTLPFTPLSSFFAIACLINITHKHQLTDFYFSFSSSIRVTSSYQRSRADENGGVDSGDDIFSLQAVFYTAECALYSVHRSSGPDAFRSCRNYNRHRETESTATF